MEIVDYVPWDITKPGISFCANSGRIFVFKKTLDAIGSPEYFRFLFDERVNLFVIEACGIDERGAQRISISKRGNYEIKGKRLVQFVYSCCQWNDRLSYRVPGDVYPDQRIVSFDLHEALELHEGRLKARKPMMMKSITQDTTAEKCV